MPFISGKNRKHQMDKNWLDFYSFWFGHIILKLNDNADQKNNNLMELDDFEESTSNDDKEEKMLNYMSNNHSLF